MKYLITAATLALSLSSQFAKADYNDDSAPAWACRMSFDGEAKGIQVIIGSFSIKGTGELTCVSPLGDKMQEKVQVTMKTYPINPNISFGAFTVHGESAEIGLMSFEPDSLFGNYLVAQGQGSLGAGAGVLTAVKVGIPELAMQIQMQLLKGFGLNVGVSKMKIERL